MNAAIASLPLILSPCLFAAQPQDEAGVSREQAALSEEQELLLRKLGRLRTSMERLAERFDSEGRTHAATLLRRALEHLDQRGESAVGTLEELMVNARGELTGGQSVEAIRRQEEVIGRLERLLSILMDRPDLDQLDDELEALRKMKKELQSLADAEAELQRETEALRQESMTDAQRELSESLARALEKQRELLGENERQARESGDLQLEGLVAELDRLRLDQETDAGVLEAWDR